MRKNFTARVHHNNLYKKGLGGTGNDCVNGRLDQVFVSILAAVLNIVNKNIVASDFKYNAVTLAA